MEFIDQLRDWLSTPKRIAITTHQKPDGDAMGSSLGLYHYLCKLNHNVKVVAPTEYADNLKWLPGTDQVVIGPRDPDQANWVFLGADLIFCLDFNHLNRINEFQDIVRESDGKKIMVDHHLEPEGFDDLRFWDASASSTAEMVYRLILELGDLDQINEDIANCLYTGLLTDTGSFKFTTTTPAVHQMAASLIGKGVSAQKVHEEIYGKSSENRLRFFGHCFSNCLKVLPEYNTAYMMVEKGVFREFNIKAGETEGLVNYALEIRGVVLGILITENEDIVKLSFRSRSGFASSEFAKNFEGGGHFYAAGGKSKTSLAETEEKLLQLLETHKEALNSSLLNERQKDSTINA